MFSARHNHERPTTEVQGPNKRTIPSSTLDPEPPFSPQSSKFFTLPSTSPSPHLHLPKRYGQTSNEGRIDEGPQGGPPPWRYWKRGEFRARGIAGSAKKEEAGE